jgi:hypothetical protein
VYRVLRTLEGFGKKMKSLVDLTSLIILIICEYQVSKSNIYLNHTLEIILLNGLLFAFLLLKLIATNVSGV